MKKNKRGQMYLITALVIISLIVGYAAVSNYSKQRSSTILYNLGDELQVESAQVTSYGIYNEADSQEIFEDFAKSYSEYAGKGRDLYFVFGNTDDFAVSAYQDLKAGEIFVDIGGITGHTIAVDKKKFVQEDFSAEGKENVRIRIQEAEYDFELDNDEYFYFVISEEIGGEKYVSTNSKKKDKSRDKSKDKSKP